MTVKKQDPRAADDPTAAARRRLALETGYAVKDPGGKISVALVYPNVYEIGMSNLGYHKIYHLLNRRDGVVCERAFLPSEAGIEFLKKNKKTLTSMETGRPIRDFDIIAFSITFEADYLNVLRVLDLAGLPLRRGDGGGAPLVMAGGIAVTLNPEPLAPFIDIAAIGEGEGIIGPLMDAVEEKGFSDLSAFAALDGVYVPSGYTASYGADERFEKLEPAEGFPEKTPRVWDKGYAASPSATVIDTPETVFGDMALVEIGKGCGRHCRFCAAGYIYRPTRHAEMSPVLAAVDSALDRRGKVGLVSSAVCDHPDIERIFARIVERGGDFSVSSLRLDRLTDSMLKNLTRGKVHTLTLAPEAGTERLRNIINKDISDEVILDTARRIAVAGDFRLKLYFLVGLPGETMEDVDGIQELVRRMHGAMDVEWRRRGRTSSITVGVDGFVPKAGTPFQWAPFGGVKEVGDKINRVARELKKIPNVSVHSGSARKAYIHAVLSMGDRRAGDLLEKAFRLGGDWRRAFAEWEMDPEFFAARRKEPGEPLPWDFIDHGLRAGYLEKEYERSGRGKTIPPCPPPGEECSRCGVFEGVCSGFGGMENAR
ncbi:MAG: radical SAM protein [Candidatus Nitrospinota bacterium M3_3B_026]